MHGTDTLNGLNLDNDEVFDEQVHPITEIQFGAVIHDRKPDLRLGAKFLLGEDRIAGTLGTRSPASQGGVR